MAVTASGLFVANYVSGLNGTIVLNLTAATNKVAMFTNSITPNFDTDTGYGAAPYNLNEVSGTGYTAGGATLAGMSLTDSGTGNMVYTTTNPSWTTSTITNARCALLYCNALVGKNAYALVNFGADYSTVAGTFTIQWSGSGIFVLDMTP